MPVEVQSRRTIKPTTRDDLSATAHPELVPLGSADFEISPEHVNMMWAFNAPAPPAKALEEGLARVLSEYREWAGRLVDDSNGRPAIELNDEGVVWVEATADGILQDEMPFDPSPFLREFFPPNYGVSELLLIQQTRFACGGLVLGVSWQHRVADTAAFFEFMNSWSQVVREQPIDPLPVHDRSLLMARDPPRPAVDHIENKIVPSIPSSDRSSEIVVKKIHFSEEFLGKVKAIASQNGERPCTRFESLLAHLWRCVSRARGLPREAVTRSSFPIDGRKRLNPALPLNYFGNAIFLACAETTVMELTERPLQFGVRLVQNALKRMDSEYLRSALDCLELHVRNKGPDSAQTSDAAAALCPHLMASSWINFPLYELDFGWGRPSYAGPLISPLEGLMVFIPSYTMDASIDVIARLFEDHMAELQQICYRA